MCGSQSSYPIVVYHDIALLITSTPVNQEHGFAYWAQGAVNQTVFVQEAQSAGHTG